MNGAAVTLRRVSIAASDRTRLPTYLRFTNVALPIGSVSPDHRPDSAGGHEIPVPTSCGSWIGDRVIVERRVGFQCLHTNRVGGAVTVRREEVIGINAIRCLVFDVPVFGVAYVLVVLLHLETGGGQIPPFEDTSVLPRCDPLKEKSRVGGFSCRCKAVDVHVPEPVDLVGSPSDDLTPAGRSL